MDYRILLTFVWGVNFGITLVHYAPANVSALVQAAVLAIILGWLIYSCIPAKRDGR